MLVVNCAVMKCAFFNHAGMVQLRPGAGPGSAAAVAQALVQIQQQQQQQQQQLQHQQQLQQILEDPDYAQNMHVMRMANPHMMPPPKGPF